MKLHHRMAPLLVLASLALAAVAQNAPNQGQGPQSQGGHRRPPPPAIDACKGKKAGDKASFTGRHNDKVEGTCRQIDDVLAVVPAGGPPREREAAGPGGKPSGDQPKK